MAGMWRQCELSDGTYSFLDLIDAHEFLDVRSENERRLEAYRKSQRDLQQHH